MDLKNMYLYTTDETYQFYRCGWSFNFATPEMLEVLRNLSLSPSEREKQLLPIIEKYEHMGENIPTKERKILAWKIFSAMSNSTKQRIKNWIQKGNQREVQAIYDKMIEKESKWYVILRKEWEQLFAEARKCGSTLQRDIAIKARKGLEEENEKFREDVCANGSQYLYQKLKYN